ncbi:hypothetical protein FGSG_05646 [Fusarium graminearum PH-1]|uniref:Zn(2)-C6 fungal-type domain-containing protein n=1 Tax=Gibberella zeae (strain ATCC MYA-4620 / CBS 123657 / FGSC 9075 / NRRL 31084 / PH-1) TaxID=229533 RepID=I1RNR1_GIBZE|nr:hypothetical protein FGSG_05646 [Fusarium graminearum PH-1]ESU11633.1 hypothetical protein FGSG_05646 [Fusarium graminearum PH-1]|eukprot:XP_011324209.1 hypothetical protein FGSG_05646 [Fusarium graminearum PH-1]
MSGLATRLRGPSRISSSQLRIQSILSPIDPGGKKQSETPSHPLPNSKRKLEELSHVREGTLPVSNWLPRHNELRHDAGDDGLIWTQTPSNSDERAGRTSYRTKLPMRSSIACVRCRRSKIKCNNDGGHSPCDHCIKGGHQCQYPEPVPIPPKRSESQAAARSEKEPHPEKKRTRKLDDVPGRNSERSTAYAAEVLAYPFLTTELWSQLLSIYKQHYATELPFIHLPSLKERMISEPGKKQDFPSELNLNSQQGHTRQRTSQPKNDPVAASDFFATVLTTALGPLRTAMDTITVERVQAFLILGLFEWSQGHKSAWMYIGVATRMAKMMKLELDDQRMGLLENQAPASQQSRTRSAEIAIVRETRRRTMYSCFILDRLMGHGSGRALSTPTDALWIQLPCSEMAFDLSLHVYTGFLRQPEGFIQPQMNDDSTLSQFIRLIDIWSDISIYISKGGREQENLPPWDNRSRFYELRARLNVFYNGLPDTFTLSRQNYYRHDNHQATNTYVSLHMLASACQIVLNREYLPFLPLRCRGPQGPLDRVQPILDHAPGGFWEESAEQVFLASRNVVDLIELCKDKLPLSSLTTFSIWLAGFMAVYARHFPHMDLKLKMTSQKMLDFAHTSNILEEEMVGTAYQALRRATTYLPAAQNYLDNFEGTNRYFSQMRKPVFQNQEVTRSTGSLDDHVQRMDSAYRHSTSPTLPSIRSTLEDPTKLAGSTSKSQFLLPGVDEEPFEIDIPKSLGRDIEMLESQRMSKVLNDLEGFSGAERLRVVFE